MFGAIELNPGDKYSGSTEHSLLGFQEACLRVEGRGPQIRHYAAALSQEKGLVSKGSFCAKS